jgi:hypothetical protein
MTVAERAAQIWPLLCLCAMRRQLLTYEELATLIGIPRHGLGQVLEPIQSYCILKGLPALSSIVISQQSGTPGEGFIAAADVPREQATVFGFRWSETPVPSPQAFQEAVRSLPSNGRPLVELLRTREELPKSGSKDNA